jgi:hypothetical protein
VQSHGVLEKLNAGKSVRVNEMADLIDCHPNTLWKAIRDGEVRSVRIGRMISIPNPEARRLAGLDIEPRSPLAA